jgi:hypothetical protein
MAYKDRALSNIINAMDIEMSYETVDGVWGFYSKTIDITVNNIDDITSNSSLVLNFNFIVPSDFPPGESIVNVYNLHVRLYHTSELDISGYFIEIFTNKLEIVFGKKPNPGENASITFVIPILQFISYVR